jgi:hypothetical protein
MSAVYYVYEHIRPDTNQAFYVGKGSYKRAYSKHQRNRHWNFVVEKAKGFSVNILAKDLDEELAFLCEMERIDQLKRLGLKLCNYTNGGDGSSGYKHSDESKAKIGQAAKAIMTGRKASDEAKQNMRKAKLGKTLSEAHKAKIGQSLIGNKMSAEAVEKSRIARIGTKRTEQQRLNIIAGKLKAKLEKNL